MVELCTSLIHADDNSNRVNDVAPPINVTTTFRYSEDDLIPAVERTADTAGSNGHFYSRVSHPNGARCEVLLAEALGGEAVVYSSGLAAFGAALTHFNPKRLFIGRGYHGCHGVADIWVRNHGLQKLSLEEVSERSEPGDLVHIESPINPYGTLVDVAGIAAAAHEKGAYVVLDATFAPPPLQDPWEQGADVVLHSCTKYFGGHSDLLGGVLAVRDAAVARQLRQDRVYLGTNIANLEAYLLIRSMRTMEMRVVRQSTSATKVVAYLESHKAEFGGVLVKVFHSSLQTEPYVQQYLRGGNAPVFSILLRTVEQCKRLPSLLKLFHHATSLGGVESLIEWRAMSDTTVEQNLLRISVGCESPEDLIADLAGAFRQL
ncbi:AER250Cp [Eremothecium gossypii ATCC 10895]|uniref:AER250Cp n=1 Tax=Eremothecium gossypii (strain ATCC 10895 / CBS 109.51 / FGSC 9923 / NRRL Y-1056) TaxID=284811 RepID=Q756K4_EREGS|nr:AER250Cp [Eremothecium gossypii ATCC 10895]AAS52931.2 AER250Cp [Eremothecium gossypii ATCC 10895]